jgi:transcriptional regulator GlxA family with amidase domain
MPHADSDRVSTDDRSPLRVAILLFDDVEVLDFAGPFEVFAVARAAAGEPAFEVVTVALRPGAVVARHALTVLPGCAPDGLGAVDILVVPGGRGTRRELHDPAMLDFIRATSASARITLSVCTGALLLGAAGLLNGQAATTHWAAMDELRGLDCGAELLPEARIVDNGALVISAGVSAGIDAALHLVSRLLGEPAARETARYLQYDWPRAETERRTVVTRNARGQRL